MQPQSYLISRGLSLLHQMPAFHDVPAMEVFLTLYISTGSDALPSDSFWCASAVVAGSTGMATLSAAGPTLSGRPSVLQRLIPRPLPNLPRPLVPLNLRQRNPHQPNPRQRIRRQLNQHQPNLRQLSPPLPQARPPHPPPPHPPRQTTPHPSPPRRSPLGLLNSRVRM